MRSGRKPRTVVRQSADVTTIIVRLHEAPRLLTFEAIAAQLRSDFGIDLTPGAIWQRYESRRTIDEDARKKGARSELRGFPSPR